MLDNYSPWNVIIFFVHNLKCGSNVFRISLLRLLPIRELIFILLFQMQSVVSLLLAAEVCRYSHWVAPLLSGQEKKSLSKMPRTFLWGWHLRAVSCSWSSISKLEQFSSWNALLCFSCFLIVCLLLFWKYNFFLLLTIFIY